VRGLVVRLFTTLREKSNQERFRQARLFRSVINLLSTTCSMKPSASWLSLICAVLVPIISRLTFRAQKFDKFMMGLSSQCYLDATV